MLQEKLKKRLLSILTNSDDIDDELVEEIAAEALLIVGSKDIKQPLILDIAIYRYLLIKGNLVSEAYEQQYKSALKALDTAPIKSNNEDSNSKSKATIYVAQREKLWY